MQHLLGTGHLMRTALIARTAAARGHDVTVVSGGMAPPHLDIGVARLVQLPPLRTADASFSRLLDAEGQAPTDDLWAARRARLLETFAAVAPDALVVEQYPFGRRTFAVELGPLLERARAARPRPVIACSLRDVLTARDDARRLDAMAAIARSTFDAVLVHGDPAVLPLAASFPPAAAIADLIRYTGYVVAPPSPRGPGTGEILVSAGGGAVAGPLLRAALGAASLVRRPWRLLVGGVALDDLLAGAPANVVIEPNRPDFRDLLAICAVSVSQGGYNTVMEVLTAGARGVIVPFATDGQTEQTQRALRLAELGLLDVVSETALSPERLAAAVTHALARPEGIVPALDVAGAGRTVDLLEAMIAGRHADVARA